MALREELYNMVIDARNKHPNTVAKDLEKRLMEQAKKGKMDLSISPGTHSSDGFLITYQEIKEFAEKEELDFKISNNGCYILSFSSPTKNV